MFVLAYLGFVTSQVRRAFARSEGSFEDGLWWQRVEQISSVARPENVMVLVPAAAAAAAGTLLVRAVVDRSVLRLAQLVRVVAGLCAVVIAIAVLGIIGVFFRNADSIEDLAALLLRLGGILMSVAMIRICLEAERSN